MTTHRPIALDRIARIPAKHALSYIHVLDVPVAEARPLISTTEALAHWCVTPVTAFELRPDGAFPDHWSTTSCAFSEKECIDTEEAAGSYAGAGGMRVGHFAAADGRTVFRFRATVDKGVTPPTARIGRTVPASPKRTWRRAGMAPSTRRSGSLTTQMCQPAATP